MAAVPPRQERKIQTNFRRSLSFQSLFRLVGKLRPADSAAEKRRCAGSCADPINSAEKKDRAGEGDGACQRMANKW